MLRNRFKPRIKMFRIALIDVLMFSLPFLVYGAYVLTTRRAGPANMWDGAPVLWLVAAGCLLILITMATLISFSGGDHRGRGGEARRDRLMTLPSHDRTRP
jgi:hypothetical protein